jgi:hypothetical protein
MRTGLRPAILVVAACGCVGASIVSACVVAPPAGLAPSTPGRPTILHGSVTPPADGLLTAWTSSTQFVVPVQLADINDSFVWDVYVDYDGDPLSAPRRPPAAVTPLPGQLDAGVYLVDFPLDPGTFAIDLTLCHTIQMLVAHGFQQVLLNGTMQVAPHLPDSVGGDTVQWTWSPPSCYTFTPDASAPAADAAGDSLPIPPSQGDAGQ